MILTVGMVGKEENSPSVASDLRSPGVTSRAKQQLFSVLRCLLIFLVSLVWFGAFAPLGLDFHHDGVMFIPALRVASGQTVFRDVFCQYGLLSPLLQGGAVWLGGGELLAMKYLSVLFYAAIAVLLDFLWKPLFSARWRNLILLMFWVLMPDTMLIAVKRCGKDLKDGSAINMKAIHKITLRTLLVNGLVFLATLIVMFALPSSFLTTIAVIAMLLSVGSVITYLLFVYCPIRIINKK